MTRSGMTVEILGADRLRTQLEDLGEDIIAALQKAVKESAEAVKADTQRDVAKDTRHLHDTVDITYKDDDLTAVVGWHNDTEYYARFLEYGTRRITARPALRPALEAERGRYKARLTEEVRRALR
ncbi:HK97-gp10 family putative phage morphogenesis protein [Streptomyces zaomyceticus]|uniref:HK97-gp10 family putative phage morphogenesis protein n=1 Tax=Streptomyces zaomyceticus TaxID=68286 RepID=UPI002E116E7F|nr:HK97 gp10 family phage protein [Streptomyces zaomyceticus]